MLSTSVRLEPASTKAQMNFYLSPASQFKDLWLLYACCTEMFLHLLLPLLLQNVRSWLAFIHKEKKLNVLTIYSVHQIRQGSHRGKIEYCMNKDYRCVRLKSNGGYGMDVLQWNQCYEYMGVFRSILEFVSWSNVAGGGINTLWTSSRKRRMGFSICERSYTSSTESGWMTQSV